MGGFVSLQVADEAPSAVAADSRLEPLRVLAVAHKKPRSRATAFAVWHSLAWLVFANAIGVLLAAMLLWPGINHGLDEWTYGRWIPVHMNLELYGWSSLPLVAFLFKAYGADHGRASRWARAVLWGWSCALAVGSASWLTGHSSGKLFLDWTDYPRVLFPTAMAALWLLLFVSAHNEWSSMTARARVVKSVGLMLLALVPVLLYISASPSLYPPINPDSGGPTGASQLESTLVIVAILLLLPFGLTRRKQMRSPTVSLSWWIFAAETLLCLGMGRADVSHHRPIQYLSLASLLLWVGLIPAYYAAFYWHANTLRWRVAFLAWWTVLVPTGWALFLPGVLDHFKFTDGLVGHSLLAMAGFASCLLIFIMVQLLGDDGWIFNFAWSFWLWQISVVVYVGLMFAAGWREGFDPSFNMVPGAARQALYAARLLVGVAMFVASVDWLVWASSLLRSPEYALPAHDRAENAL